MKTTKQKPRYMITLPSEAMPVLRWHVGTHLSTPEQKESELLIPVHALAKAIRLFGASGGQKSERAG